MSIVPVSFYMDPGAEEEERWVAQGIIDGVGVRGRGRTMELAAAAFEGDLDSKIERIEEETGVNPSRS